MEANLSIQPSILPSPEEEEEWRPAPGFEDRYEVSSFGNVRHKKTQRLRKINYDKSGYPIVCIHKGKKIKYVYIHRLVCEAFNGPPTPDHNICDHRDRCVVNNYYNNLRWTDYSGNLYNRRPTRKIKLSIQTTPIVFLDHNGKSLQRFSSIHEAHQVLGLSEEQIMLNVRGFRAPFSEGYFRVAADYDAKFDGEKNF